MIETLIDTAKRCGTLLRDLQRGDLAPQDKDETFGAHFYTSADIKSQALAIQLLRRAHPGETIIAEEQANAETVPPNCTVVDPVDGTGAYFSGCREYGITLCTLRDGRPVHGVIYFPDDDVLLRATRGAGWFVNEKRMPQLSWDRPLDKTMIGTDIGPWTVPEVLQPLSKQFNVRSMMVAVWGARAIVTKETGMYFNLNVAKIWDAAAGSLIIEEAGGVACAPDGSPLQWNLIAMDWVWAVTRELAQEVVTYTTHWPGRKGGT